EYDIIAPNYKCNMTDIMAAIGLAQLKRYPQMLQRRRQIIEIYNEGLKNCNVQLLKHYGENYASSGHLYLVRLLGKGIEERNEIISKMAELGIACNVHYKPLPMMTAYKNLGFNIADYPNAYNQYKNEVTLPLHTKLTDDEIEYIIDSFSKLLI
ncbi:MAG: DegT/DnrJ/EryC1/StrS family aminotransferase, partial [Paludibacteraceae bacterium]|nr:DegT/DnrJ/EryC1/StrS family aminotransferase [Paludibacteraceae bacterium]